MMRSVEQHRPTFMQTPYEALPAGHTPPQVPLRDQSHIPWTPPIYTNPSSSPYFATTSHPASSGYSPSDAELGRGLINTGPAHKSGKGTWFSKLSQKAKVMLLLLILLVIGGAVGGGVGAAMANKNKAVASVNSSTAGNAAGNSQEADLLSLAPSSSDNMVRSSTLSSSTSVVRSSMTSWLTTSSSLPATISSVRPTTPSPASVTSSQAPSSLPITNSRSSVNPTTSSGGGGGGGVAAAQICTNYCENNSSCPKQGPFSSRRCGGGRIINGRECGKHCIGV